MHKSIKLFLLILILGGCKPLFNKGNVQASTNYMANVDFHIDVSEYNSRIEMTFINMDTIPIVMSNPACWINVRPTLLEHDQEVTINQKIKPNPNCAKKMIWLKPKEKYNTVFPYDIGSLYTIQKNKSYVISLVYYGGISNSQGKSVDTKLLESNKFSFKQ